MTQFLLEEQICGLTAAPLRAQTFGPTCAKQLTLFQVSKILCRGLYWYWVSHIRVKSDPQLQHLKPTAFYLISTLVNYSL